MSEATPLPINRQEKLKLFVVVALHKDVPAEVIKDKIGLLLLATYSKPEALLAAAQALAQMGKDPTQHVVPHMIIERNAEDVVVMPPIAPVDPKPTLAKSKEEMTHYVQYVFNNVNATPVQIDVMNEVIGKFLAPKHGPT